MLCVPAVAQSPQGPVASDTPVKKGIVYNKQFTFGAKLASNGWAVTFNTGKIKSIYTTRIFEFELADIRHPKEKKQPAEFNLYGQLLGNPKDFYFGKQND